MHLSSANRGDVLCLYQTGQYIKILDVDERTVSFMQESGETGATFATTLDAIAETDPERIALFDRNSRLGRTLRAAEYKAWTIMHSGISESHPDYIEANQLLNTVRQQLQFFEKRLAQEHQQGRPSLKLASDFLSNLYELGTGSHDTFWGHRVEIASQMTGQIMINGQHCDYSTALDRLSQGQVKQKAKGLSEQIANAEHRKNSATCSPIHQPSHSQEH